MIGSNLGPYKIIEQLGAGGMGEVYLGEDTRLGRKVAIKVLPEAFASDPERLARFEQEARAAAALNHPHIAVVHDIGFEPSVGADDQASAGTHFMVQEFLDGAPLRQPIEAGAMPLDKALNLAVEIAEGLNAAHVAGIVHRDLKPDNVFVTRDGHAKILDFGLAKLTEAAAVMGPEGSASRSPTMLGTVAGQVMGTAGYMAPEQIEATEEIDQRADLFAFGAVLYEMVTGKRAFAGDSVLDTLHAIARTDPISIGAIDPNLPAELHRILRKAMAKDPGRRYQRADELVVDLKQLRDDIAAGEITPIGFPQSPASGADPGAAPGAVPGAGSSVGPATATAPAARGVVAAVGIVAVLLGIAAGWWARGAPPEQPRLDLYAAAGDVRPSGAQPLAISPDGTVVALIGEGVLRFRRLGQTEWVDAAEANNSVALFSADGSTVYYIVNGEVWGVALDGSPPQLVADTGAAFLFSGWRDGRDAIVVSGIHTGNGSHMAWRIVPDRGEINEVWRMDGAGAAREALYLAGRIDERRFVGIRVSQTDGPIAAGLIDADAGEIGQWRQGLGSFRVAPDGRVLGVDARGRLLSFPLTDDGESLATNAVTILDGLQTANGFAAYDIAADGTIVLVAGGVLDIDGGQRLVWYDEAGRTEMVAGRSGAFDVDTRLSSDGAFLALEAPFDNIMSVWIHDIARDVTTPLAVDHPGAFPVWSPDGSEIVYHVQDAVDRPPGIYRAPVDRSTPPEIMLPDPEGEYLLPMDWSPDGRTLLYVRSPDRFRAAGSDLWTVAVDAGEPSLFIGTAANEIDGRFSPDGRWIAYVSDHSGVREVYVRPSGGGGEVTISSGGAANPEWHPLQPTLYFRGPSPSGEGTAVSTVDFVDGVPSAVREITRIPARSSNLFIVGPDGERFMTAVSGADLPPAQLRVVLNPDAD